MSEGILSFSRELGKLLAKYRKLAKLSQAELAERIGFSKKRGYCHISQLETGKEKKPSLYTILRYLKTCQVAWPKFFQELSAIDFKIEHKKVMSEIELPSSLSSDQRKKIDRDTALYLTKIQYPKTPFQKLDWDRIKTKIDKKVKTLLFNHKLDENAKQPYFNLMNELIANYDTRQNPIILKRHWDERILNRPIMDAIRKIVYQTVRLEQKRLQKQKALPSEKYKKMAGAFLRYRITIEPIEAEVQKKLGELNVPIALNQAYKNFTRECYSALKKYYHKDRVLLSQRFSEIMRSYKPQGLNEKILLQIKEMIIARFNPLDEKK